MFAQVSNDTKEQFLDSQFPIVVVLEKQLFHCSYLLYYCNIHAFSLNIVPPNNFWLQLEKKEWWLVQNSILWSCCKIIIFFTCKFLLNWAWIVFSLLLIGKPCSSICSSMSTIAHIVVIVNYLARFKALWGSNNNPTTLENIETRPHSSYKKHRN